MRAIRPIAVVLVGAAFWPLGARAAAPPTSAQTFEEVLRQTAAVVEGSVEDISYRYDEAEGPRSVATLSRLVVHIGSLGKTAPNTIELRSFGGPLPDGREMFATHVPALLPGKRYVLFLRNTDWSLSPVAFEMAFRVEEIDVRGFVGAVRAFASAHGVTPSGEFSPFPVIESGSFRRLFAARAEPSEGDDAALACMDAGGGDGGDLDADLLVCKEEGGH